jgi:hypothetical protein
MRGPITWADALIPAVMVGAAIIGAMLAVAHWLSGVLLISWLVFLAVMALGWFLTVRQT